MGHAIGSSLPLAIGVALSPAAIIAVVLLLTTRSGRVNAVAFAVGWVAGLAVIGAIVLVIAGPAGAGSGSGSAGTGVSWVKVGVGVLLLFVAVRQFRGRPHENDETPMPRWMGAVDRLRPLAAFGAGAVLAANPKNLLLAIGAATAIAQTGIPGVQQAVAYAIFAVIGTLGVAVPIGIAVAMGERSARLLGELKDWMARHNAVIMAVLCLVIGAKLIGDGISGLA